MSTDLRDLLPVDERHNPLWWQAFSLCAQVGGDVLFPEKGQSAAPAKALCAACDVRAECLEYALANGEKFGVWGGKTERERSALKRDRRKAEAAQAATTDAA